MEGILHALACLVTLLTCSFLQYVVNALRKATYERYEKDGTFIPEPEPEHEAVAIVDDKEEKEEPMDIFAGTLGKFLAEKGALLREIEKVSGCRKVPKLSLLVWYILLLEFGSYNTAPTAPKERRRRTPQGSRSCPDRFDRQRTCPR